MDESEAELSPLTSKQTPEDFNMSIPGQESPIMEVQVSGDSEVTENEDELCDDSGISDGEKVSDLEYAAEVEREAEVQTETEVEIEDDDECEPNPEDMQPSPKARPLNYPELSKPLVDSAISKTSPPKLIGYLNSSASSHGSQFVSLSDLLSTPCDLSKNVSLQPSERPLEKEKLALSDHFPDPGFTQQPNSQKSQSQPEPSHSTAQALHKTNPFRPLTPKTAYNPGQPVENVDQSHEKSSSHLEKSRISDQAALDLFDWISPNTLTSIAPVLHTEITQANSAKTSRNNPFLINLNPESAAIASTNAIAKSKMSKAEMASAWNYRPPTPSRFQDCEVDSGNVDALVSQVLQSSHAPGPITGQIKSENDPNAENIGRRKSQFFNPGISINFNYNPLFTTDASWTWNHQQPPGSPSAYFTSDVAPSNPPEEDQVEACQTPPYLLSHDASVSDVSLLPMVDSIPKISLSVSSPDDLSPEDPPSDSDVELPRYANKSSKKSAKKSVSKRNKEREQPKMSPLGCRIIEILNQFNKIEEDDIADTIPDNSNPSRTPSSRNVNFWDRRTSSHAMMNRANVSNTPRPATDAGSLVNSEGNRMPPSQSRSTFEPSSYEIKRNIVLENILLAKFPRRRSSVHIFAKSLSHRPSVQVLAQNPKSPGPESSNVSRTSSIHGGRVQPILKPQPSRPPVPPPRLNRSINPDNLHKGRSVHHHYHEQSHARIENQELSRSQSRSRILLGRTRTEAMVSRSRARIQEAQNVQARANRIQNAQIAQSRLNQLGGRAVSRNSFRPTGPSRNTNTNANNTSRVRVQPHQSVQIPRNAQVQVPRNQNVQNRQPAPVGATETRLTAQFPSTAQNRSPYAAYNREQAEVQIRETNRVLTRNVRKNQVNATNSVPGRISWTRKPNSENDTV